MFPPTAATILLSFSRTAATQTPHRCDQLYLNAVVPCVETSRRVASRRGRQAKLASLSNLDPIHPSTENHPGLFCCCFLSALYCPGQPLLIGPTTPLHHRIVTPFIPQSYIQDALVAPLQREVKRAAKAEAAAAAAANEQPQTSGGLHASTTSSAPNSTVPSTAATAPATANGSVAAAARPAGAARAGGGATSEQAAGALRKAGQGQEEEEEEDEDDGDDEVRKNEVDSIVECPDHWYCRVPVLVSARRVQCAVAP